MHDPMLWIWLAMLLTITPYRLLQLMELQKMQAQGISVTYALRRSYWDLFGCALSGIGFGLAVLDPDLTGGIATVFYIGLMPLIAVCVIGRWLTTDDLLED